MYTALAQRKRVVLEAGRAAKTRNRTMSAVVYPMNKVQFGRFKASYRRKGAEWMLLVGLCGCALFG